MYRYVIKRLLWVIPIMLGVLVIVFTISYFTPGDPVLNKIGSNYTPELYAETAKIMGLDKGFFGQLGSYIWNLVTKLDMGTSYSTNVAISKEIAQRLPITFELNMLSIIFSVLIGIPLGIYSAVRQYSVSDIGLTALAIILSSVPSFVLALFGILFFGVYLKWLPLNGLDSFKHWILPVGINMLVGIAPIMRMTRTNMLEVIRQDYIRTARAKGQKESVIIRRHALKNCLIPLVTVLGGVVASSVAGSIIAETIFGIPGMGLYMMAGINGRDYPVVNGVVLMMALIVCLVNLLVDVIYAYIDPRIKVLYQTPRSKLKYVEQAVKADSEGA